MRAPEMKHKWKKEAVVAYKFDYIDKDIIISESLWWRFTYLGIYFALIRTILMYAADIFSIVVLFVPFLKAADGQSISVAGSDWLTFFGTAMDEGLRTAFKWLYVASVGVSLCLLIVDAYKAQKIIRSRDISLAMTSLTARRWYSMKQYAYYCLFQRLAAARKTKDGLAFFTFYSLKGNLGSLLHKKDGLMSKIGWKRFLFAESIRAVINLNTIYIFTKSRIGSSGFITLDATVSTFTAAFLCISLLIYSHRLVTILAAVCMYIPLERSIHGPLKEYVCHKIDKRLETLLKEQRAKIKARQQEIDAEQAMKRQMGGDRKMSGSSLSSHVPKSPSSDQARLRQLAAEVDLEDQQLYFNTAQTNAAEHASRTGRQYSMDQAEPLSALSQTHGHAYNGTIYFEPLHLSPASLYSGEEQLVDPASPYFSGPSRASARSHASSNRLPPPRRTRRPSGA